jgi:hydroxymethylglutaryl-CoA lyase
MGFGNPYGDAYDEDMVHEWVEKIAGVGVKIISLADTVGLASPQQVSSLMGKLIPSNPDITLGVHLHSSPAGRVAKLAAALDAGCRRFDGAIHGIGGCPMAGDELVGNMDTEFMLNFFEDRGLSIGTDEEMLNECAAMAMGIFSVN